MSNVHEKIPIYFDEVKIEDFLNGLCAFRYKGQDLPAGSWYVVDKAFLEEIQLLMHSHELIYSARPKDSRKKSIAVGILIHYLLHQ